MIKSIILAGAALVLAAGCATYEQGGLFGGFNEVPLASDTYRIQGYGNAFAEFNFTSRAQTNAIALVRAAELAGERGYERFIVLDYNEWARTAYFSTPTTASTTVNFDGTATTKSSGWATPYGSSTYYSGRSNTDFSGQSRATTTIKHGETYAVDSPRTDIVVRFVRSGSWEAGKALIASEIIARYGPVAGLKPEQIALLLDKSPRPTTEMLVPNTDMPPPEAAQALPPEPFGPPQLTRRVTNRY